MSFAGEPQIARGTPQSESEDRDKDSGYSGRGIAVFVNNVTRASSTDSGTICNREGEFWQIFFCLFALCGGLLLYAGMKG